MQQSKTKQIIECDSEFPPSVSPVESEYVIGAHYFMGWWGPERWAPVSLNTYLGGYDIRKTSVVDWQAKWAREHGIRYFSWQFTWHHGLDNQPVQVSAGGLDALLKGNRAGDGFKFAIHWTTEYYQQLVKDSRGSKYFDWGIEWDIDSPADFTHDFSEEDFLNFFSYAADHYFSHPAYLKVKGRALFTLYRSNLVLRAFGVQRWREILEKIRAMLKSKGHDLFLVAGGSCRDEGFIRAVKAAGFDAVTAYNYPQDVGKECGLSPKSGRRMRVGTYEQIVQRYEELWETTSKICRELDLVYVVPLLSGFDNTPWGANVIMTGGTPELFRTMCEKSKKYIDPNWKMVEICAWNEWGEGSNIEPCRELGFSYLDVIRDVFTGQKGDHQDMVPKNVEPYCAV